jgi:Carbohydrate binding domain
MRFILLYCTLIPFVSFAQSQKSQIIAIENGSFEASAVTLAYHTKEIDGKVSEEGQNPSNGEWLEDWKSCGFKQCLPLSVQPGNWACTKPAYDGKQYISLLTRTDATYQWTSQQLSKPLVKGQTYMFSLYAARSVQHLSVTKKDSIPRNYDAPCRIVIAGGNSSCISTKVLSETSAIVDTDWRKISFQFTADKAYTFLQIQAFYEGATLQNGNVLIDNMSDLLPIDSTSLQPMVVLPKMDTAALSDRAEIERIIAQQIKNFKLDTKRLCVPKEWFWQRNKLQYANFPLASCLRAASKVPNTTIVIHLKTDAFEDWQIWQAILYRYFKNNYNIDKNHIVIEESLKEDAKTTWIAKTPQLLIRLE